jgi:hypothetical protein
VRRYDVGDDIIVPVPDQIGFGSGYIVGYTSMVRPS